SFVGLSNDDLYALRQDAYGVPISSIARMAAPDASTEGVGRVHLRLRSSGAVLDGRYYKLNNGKKVRVVNGKTNVLSSVKAEFSNEPPPALGLAGDLVICVGAYDDGGAATNVGRPATSPTIVRAG